MSLSSFFPNLSILQRRHLNMPEAEALLDLIPFAALLVDLSLERILLANARATELTAFTRSELANRDLPDLIPGLAGGNLYPESKSLASKLSTRVTTRQGMEVEVTLTLNHLDGAGALALVELEPVSVQKRKEEERNRQDERLKDLNALILAEQERDFHRALESALEIGHRITGAPELAIYLADLPKSRLQCANTWGETKHLPAHISLEDLSGMWSPNLWRQGKRATNSLQRAARSANCTFLATAPLGDPGAFTGLVVITSPDASPPDEILSLLKILATAITGIIQHHLQVTSLRQEKKNRVISLAIGEAVKEGVQDGVLILAKDLTIVEMNPATEWALGYAMTEIRGQPVENVVIGAENLIPALQAAQQGIPTPNLGNVRLLRRDGSTFLAHIRLIPVTVKDHLEGVVLLLRDLSEHEQYQVRKQQLEQRALLGEVTAILAHELRNPINNISTGLQWMAMNLPKDDPNQEVIVAMDQDCNRLEFLIQSVLSFSRPEENKTVSVDIRLLIQRLFDRWRPRFAKVNVQHQLQVITEHPCVQGDPRTLEQVFTNLISNAVEAMSATGGNLTVTIRPFAGQGESGEQIEVDVADTGPGIPEKDREHIFDPFFTTSRHGTGLGLAIAKRIVTTHKGTIRVSSVPGGTVFQVVLPTAKNS